MWGLHLDPLLGVYKGTFPNRPDTLLYAVLSWACVQYRWRCVSLEEKTHLETPGGQTPKLSLCTYSFGSWSALGSRMESLHMDSGGYPSHPLIPVNGSRWKS